MKKILLLIAAALILATLLPEDASAQRGRGYRAGGGYRGVAVGGYRGARLGYRGVGYGYRGVGYGYRGYGYRGVGYGYRGYGYRGYGYRTAWVGGPYYRRYGGYPWRARWPIAAGVAAVGYYYGAPYYPAYYDTCVVWNGYGWVNVCYPY